MGGLGARTRDREQLFDWIHVKVGLWLGVDMGGGLCVRFILLCEEGGQIVC